MKIHLLFLFILAGCSSLNPSEEDINKAAADAYAKVKAESKINKDPEINAMVDRVATRIAKNSGKNYDWEWIVIESEEQNAWAMPGGKMAVYTGILPIVKTEAGLAAVLGHEVAHVTEKHGNERYARAVKSNVTGLVIGVGSALAGQFFCKTQTCQTLTGLGGAAAGFAIQFFDMKFSREQETEADKVGLDYMAKSGYRPEEALNVWKRMEEASKGAPPEVLSTHPSNETRQKNISSWLPEANETYSKAPNKLGDGATIKSL